MAPKKYSCRHVAQASSGIKTYQPRTVVRQLSVVDDLELDTETTLCVLCSGFLVTYLTGLADLFAGGRASVLAEKLDVIEHPPDVDDIEEEGRVEIRKKDA